MLKVVLLLNWGLGFEVLRVLHKMNNIEIGLVVSQYKKESPDIWYNIVYDFAVEQGYNTIPENSISFGGLRERITSCNIDLLVSHAFMKILPPSVFKAPRLGSINIHPSLLPKYRGPSPTQWVIKNKDKVTGLTCHYIEKGIDSGDIIDQVIVKIEHKDNIDSIIEKQKLTVDNLLRQSLKKLLDVSFKPVPQREDLVCYAPRI